MVMKLATGVDPGYQIQFLCVLLIYILLLLRLSSHAAADAAAISDQDGSSSFQKPPIQCHQEEMSALLEFKKTLFLEETLFGGCSDDVYKKKLESWRRNNNVNCCTWRGVQCDEHSGRVVGLDLSPDIIDPPSCLRGSNLNSSSSIFRLVHLRRLNLARVYFDSSTIPPAIGNLSQLQLLNLSECAFSGHVPWEILTLANLSSLDLSGNTNHFFGHSGLKLKEPAGIEDIARSLTKLVHLHLNSVNISAPFPRALANLSSLESLQISDSNLQGELPASIFFWFPQLEHLDLSHNPGLYGHLPEFSRTNNLLKILRLQGANFSGELPHSLGNLGSLTEFDISDNKFNGLIPSFENCTQLSYLDLSMNELSGPISPSIGNLTRISYLNLNRNQLTGLVPSSIGNLIQLSSLDFSFNQLIGSVPTSIGNLNQLSDLYLHYNQLTGPIPTSIGNLSGISSLDLQYNQLTGPIPPSIGNLIQLPVLSLRFNKLTGSIPHSIGNLSRLCSLDLSCNQLTGLIPSQVGNLTQLFRLRLSFNGLYGPLPNSFSQLTNLYALQLYSNNLNGTLQFDAFAQLQNLYVLDISLNKFSVAIEPNMNVPHDKFSILGLGSCNLHEFPRFLQEQNRLMRLDLSNNDISGQVPNWFLNVSANSLRVLNLSGNALIGFSQHPTVFSWRSLEILDLSFNELHGSLPVPPSSIKFYFISSNRLSGGVPPSICSLGDIRMLDLGKNNFSGVLPQCLANLTESLLVLSLHDNNFVGTIPDLLHKSGLCSLKMVDAGNNQLQGSLPRSLSNCTELEFLNVGNNKMVDTCPSWLGSLPSLRVLILHSNRFHGAVEEPKNDAEFPNLQIINLSQNNFSGFLPSKNFLFWHAMMDSKEGQPNYLGEVIPIPTTYIDVDEAQYEYPMKIINKGIEMVYGKISKYLTVIDFSSNNFSGEIPKSIGSLGGLHSLNVSNNRLTGHIPPFLKDLRNLEALDLSQNMLSGDIPPELTQLTFFRSSMYHTIGCLGLYLTGDNSIHLGTTLTRET